MAPETFRKSREPVFSSIFIARMNCVTVAALPFPNSWVKAACDDSVTMATASGRATLILLDKALAGFYCQPAQNSPEFADEPGVAQRPIGPSPGPTLSDTGIGVDGSPIAYRHYVVVAVEIMPN
jgi:hypothetical protein